MDDGLRQLTDFLSGLGIAHVPHTRTTFLAHLVAVYRLMGSRGCSEEACRAGLFHSIYGTQRFQKFKLPVERRPEVRALIGERAERLAYVNCAADRASLDSALDQPGEPYRVLDRLTGEELLLSREDFDDLCRVHLYDWLEQVPRSREWGYRRGAYRRMAERLGDQGREAFDRTYAAESVP